MPIFIRALVALLVVSVLLQLSSVNGQTDDVKAKDFTTSALWLADAAYCPTNYLNHNFIGPSEGFVAVANLAHDASDTHGYVGYSPNDEAIYIVFRGSTSFTNWMTDFDTTMTPYSACESCLVHSGFSSAYSHVKDTMYSFFKELQIKFPSYAIVVTGHSLGGALATVAATEMMTSGVKEVQLITFGSPRVGNEAYASYSSSNLRSSIRVTHYRDPAPHCPYHQWYTHVAGERYEDEHGDIRLCTGYEDPTCSYQWYYTQISDHMQYLGLKIGCKYVSDKLEQSLLLASNHTEPEDLLYAKKQ